MGRKIVRGMFPIVVLAAGIGSLLYGVLVHTASVAEEKEITVKIPIPSPFAPFGPPGAGGPDGFSSDDMPPLDVPEEGEESSPFETPAEPEEESPFETPDDEEESPFESPDDEEPSPFEEPVGGMPGPGPIGGPDPFGPPGMFGAPQQFVEETEIELVLHDVSEPAMIREITFGGVTRLANGLLKRTYSGKAPSLCPT